LHVARCHTLQPQQQLPSQRASGCIPEVHRSGCVPKKKMCQKCAKNVFSITFLILLI
jgi:hypothetical protein